MPVYKVILFPYFLVDAEDQDAAIKEAVQYRVASRTTVKEPEGILATTKKGAYPVDWMVAQVKEEVEKDESGQSGAAGETPS